MLLFSFLCYKKKTFIGKKASTEVSAFICGYRTKLYLALFYIIPIIANFEIFYRLVSDEKETFLKFIFYS